MLFPLVSTPANRRAEKPKRSMTGFAERKRAGAKPVTLGTGLVRRVKTGSEKEKAEEREEEKQSGRLLEKAARVRDAIEQECSQTEQVNAVVPRRGKGERTAFRSGQVVSERVSCMGLSAASKATF